MEQAKYYVYIDDIVDDKEKNKFVGAMVLFGISKNDKTLFYGQVYMFYEDEDTSEYIRDIQRTLREPTSIRTSGKYAVKVYNKDYGDLVISVPSGMTIKQVKELLKEIGREI
jgi:ERCC4-type nuclease